MEMAGVRVCHGDNIGRKAIQVSKGSYTQALSQNKDNAATRASSPMLTLTSDK